MPPLPARFAGLILAFAPLFVHRSWRHAQVLLIGAILTPGRRTVTSALRIMGRAHERRFVNAHRILNRAAWCPRAGSRLLLGLLIGAFAPRGPVVLGLDDTIERRWGRRIRARGIYRDPVRSSDRHFVKASGLRWMSLMLLVPIPWAGRIWALPFLTALVPSERACRERSRRHKPLLDVGRQLALQALLCTDPTREPAQIVAWFVRRWCVEVTFQEVRTHLGVETQRQWSDTAIARTTPCLLALFSIVTLLAAHLPARQRRRIAAAAWYPKPRPTFADALAAVRCALWRERVLATSPRRRARTKPRFRLQAPWAYALCHPA